MDHVLPRAPYRQWVFTVPKPLRLVLARDPAWTSWVGGLVVRAISAWQRRVARKRGVRTPLTGAVTFVQRFGGLVDLNVHYHPVVPDGVFVDDGDGLRFEMLPVPTNAEVLAILDRIMRQIARRLANDAAGGDVDEDAVHDVLGATPACKEKPSHQARSRAAPRTVVLASAGDRYVLAASAWTWVSTPPTPLQTIPGCPR